MSAKRRKTSPRETKPREPAAERDLLPEPAVAAKEAFGWQQWAFGPIAAVRPYLATRVLLWILAFDVWSTHLGAAWRYGTAGFNVAHFAVLDALPIPTAGAYVGMLALVSSGAAVAATMKRPPRWLTVAIAVLYLWGWSSSMHDSYQHHYLISWLLLAIAVIPSRDATELFGPPSSGLATLPHGLVPRTHAWTFRLLCIVPATVYGYTAISKLEPEWRNGEALSALTHGGQGLESPIASLASLGVTGEEVWPFLGGTTIAIQIVVSLAYALVPVADLDLGAAHGADRLRGWALGAGAVFMVGGGALFYALGHAALMGLPTLLGIGLVVWSSQRWGTASGAALTTGAARGVGLIGWFAAIAFHLGAEAMGLEIGWFSYYMIALATAMLLPAHWLGAVLLVPTLGHRWLRSSMDEQSLGPLPPLALALFAAGSLFKLASDVGVPGADLALAIPALAIVGVGVAATARESLRRPGLGAAVGLLLCVAGTYVSLGRTDEQYDFFRFAGGDFRRRGEVHEAFHAYSQALDLAPTEEDRARIRARLEELDALR
jgi:hypothetical protein